MELKEMVYDLAKQLSDKKAVDISIINIGERASFADYFINATAGSDRQLDALTDVIEDRAAELGLPLRGAEGKVGSGWTLIDCGDIIVNIFTAAQRERYSLDKIWSDCDTESFEE